MTAPRNVSLLLLLFFLLLSSSLVAFVGAAQNNNDNNNAEADVSFVNFSSEPVPLYWYDFGEEDYVQVATMQPYEIVQMNTFIGHKFGYDVDYITMDDDDGGDEENEDDDKMKTFEVKEKKAVHPIGINPKKQKEHNDKIQVLCSTTKGDLHITVKPTWSPLGAARFLELVTKHYFNGCALNRVVKGFLTQFGISSSYELRTDYRVRTIADDVPPTSTTTTTSIDFKPGYMAYAGSGPNSRTTEMFVVMPDTPRHQLEAFGTNPWETPFAFVDLNDVQNVVGNWYAYGDMPPWGKGPDPQLIYKEDGYEYLKNKFPQMDYIDTCNIVTVDEVEEEL